MKVVRSIKFLFIAALLAAPAAQAQWSGKAELGALLATGNTEAKSGNTKLDIAHDSDKLKNSIYVAALYGENAEFVTAERYEARYQLDFKITDRFSWFVGARGEEDKFSGFAYQATVNTGATYKFIDNPTTKLDGSLGVGYKRFETELLIKTAAGEVISRIKGDQCALLFPGETCVTDSEPVATLSSNYEHAFTESTKITNKFLSEIGSDNTNLQDDIALQVSMSQTLALAVGYGVRYNSDPPSGSKTTDTQLTINLVYNIK
jgi:putative salt-induced outer membrane protein